MGFLAIASPPVMSQNNAHGMGCPISISPCFIQIRCLLAKDSAIYSAWVVAVATVGCFLDFHDTAQLPTIKTYEEKDFRESGHEA